MIDLHAATRELPFSTSCVRAEEVFLQGEDFGRLDTRRKRDRPQMMTVKPGSEIVEDGILRLGSNPFDH